ncbi:MAG: PDZ domain-containing protein, partial [Bdellovibrionales bacterium]|nr:PDZ domain-containing protein [Bdellovibrionales bacterium]
NTKVKDVNHLRNMVAQTKPETSVPVMVFREGDEKKLSIRIGELEQNEAEMTHESDDINEDVGVRVETLTPELQKRLGIETDYGVVVAQIAPFSLASEAGLQVRDLILKVGDTKVRTTREFYKAIETSDLAKGVRLIVESGGMKRFVFLKDNQ